MRSSARTQFDQWAHRYDRSRLNELVFFPSIRICLEEIERWQRFRGRGEFQMLDVGCGTGTLLQSVARLPESGQLVGLDYSPVMVRRCAEKLAANPAADRLHVVVGDSERLPFADQSFDVVTCCNSFHHYPHQAEVIRTFRRVLKPSGLLILIDGFRDNVIGWVVFDVGVAFVERNVHHARWSELHDWITEAGFATLRQRKVNVLAPLLVNIAHR